MEAAKDFLEVLPKRWACLDPAVLDARARALNFAGGGVLPLAAALPFLLAMVFTLRVVRACTPVRKHHLSAP